jgi:hypothetical protein
MKQIIFCLVLAYGVVSFFWDVFRFLIIRWDSWQDRRADEAVRLARRRANESARRRAAESAKARYES